MRREDIVAIHESVTLARSASDTFAGIRPIYTPGFSDSVSWSRDCCLVVQMARPTCPNALKKMPGCIRCYGNLLYEAW